MRSFLKTLKRQDGFTLVELMVVVAIIGLLSAVAVPNFKKYQAKAKISEAKLQLSALYTAEASFFSDYNMYAHCLTYMGFDPGPEFANRYYAIGFETPNSIEANAYASAVNSGLNSVASTGCPNGNGAVPSTAAGVSANSTNQFAAGKGIGSAIAVVGFIPASTIGTQTDLSTMTFSAGAGGVIAAGFVSDTTASTLTIDERKVLRNLVNGY